MVKNYVRLQRRDQGERGNMVTPIPTLIGLTGKLVLIGVSLKTLQGVQKISKSRKKVSLRRLTEL